MTEIEEDFNVPVKTDIKEEEVLANYGNIKDMVLCLSGEIITDEMP